MENIHWFLDPIKYQYTDFTGRATRQQYWMYALWYLILYVGIFIVGGFFGVGALSILFSFAVLIPSIAIATRRLHDTDMSGWWQLIGFIPLLGILILLYLLVQPGQTGPNRFGPDPKGGSTGQTGPTPVPGVSPTLPPNNPTTTV